MTIQIDALHREHRYKYLDQFALAEGPEETSLIEPDINLNVPFSTKDLYDLCLTDLIKALPSAQREAMKIPGGTLRGMIQAHAVAMAHGLMMIHLMTRYEPC